MEQELQRRKRKANDIYNRALLLQGHTAGKNLLFEATSEYYQILQMIEETSLKSDERIEYLLGIKLKVLLNLAACSIKLESYDTCINCCNSVLEIDPRNEKGLYRKGFGLTKQEHWVEAKILLSELITNYPRNTAAKKLLHQCELNILKLQAKKSEAETLARATNWQIDSEFLVRNSLEDCTKNGNIETVQDVSISWSQSLNSLTIIMSSEKLSSLSNLKSLRVILASREVTVLIADEIIFKQSFFRNILCENSFFEQEKDILTRKPYLRLNLIKNNFGFTGNMKEWWPRAFTDSTSIDVSKCLLSEDQYHELPKEVRTEWQRNIVEGSRTISAEEEEMIRRAKKGHEERLMNNKKASQDPAKKKFLNMMAENYPDIPVEFR